MVRSRWALVIGCLVVAACYNPSIKPGALKCAGQTCPDNFHCASDGLCYPPDAGPDLPPKPVCMSETPNVQTCPRSGVPCNPTCGTGCDCGWCGLDLSGAVACLKGTPGTKTTGSSCDPSNANDCAPGLTCKGECGGSTGRCYKFCETNDDCASGTTCNMSVGSIHLCSLPDPGCDPVKQTGCPSGLACYPSGSRTVCDCPGTAGTGVGCLLGATCLPGYQCVSLTGMSTDGTCQRLCRTSLDCGAASTCVTSGTTYGYCSP